MKTMKWFVRKIQTLAPAFILFALLISRTPLNVRAAAGQEGGISASVLFGASSIKLGETVTASLLIENIPPSGLTGADFDCQTSPTLLKFQGYQESGRFGTDPVLVVKNSAEAGLQRFAISRSGENPAAQNGAVFQITYLAVNPGQAEMACTVWVTGPDNAAQEIPFSKSSVTIEPALPQNGEINGTVVAGKPVTISIVDTNTGEVIAKTTVDEKGDFHLELPAGTYKVRAQAEGYLKAEGSFTVLAAQIFSAPLLILPAGDINGDNVVDELDVVTLATVYGEQSDAPMDLNGDGKVNLVDLVLLGLNYRKAGPASW